MQYRRQLFFSFRLCSRDTPAWLTNPSTTDLHEAKLATAPKSIAKALEKLSVKIGAHPDADENESLTVGDFKPVSFLRAAEMLKNAETVDAEAYDPDNDDNNIQFYKAAETKVLIDYLKEQAGPGAKVYVADSSDQSSEWFGVMFAVQKDDKKSFTLAQVVNFKT